MNPEPTSSTKVTRPTKKAATFPLTLPHGVKIYRGERSKGGKRYQEFTVVWSQGGRRERRFFADLDAAKAEAALVVTRFDNGQLDVLALSGTDRETYLQARRRADLLKVPLLSILDQYEAAVAKLDGKATLAEAADYWRRNCDQKIIPQTLAKACAEIQERRKAEGSSVQHLGTLKVYLGQISAAFPEAKIDRITQKDLTNFLHSGDRTKLSARSRNNLRATLTNLFNFAKGEGYLAKDRSTAADGLKRMKEPRGEVEVFTPTECRQILDVVLEHRPALIPYVVVSLFGGARTAEAKRLDWADVRLTGQNPHIILAASKAKTAARRLLPVHPTLAQWLTPLKKERGPIVTAKRPQETVPALVLSKANLAWKKNALRHSFISYRLAELKNVAEVALEAGNSPQILFRHYRELVTPEDAAAFWALTPPADFVTEVISDQAQTQ
jgi:integrase